MSQVSVTMRMDEDVKALWRELAAQDNRSLVGYMELLLTRERDRLANEQFTLKDVMDAVNNGNNRILEKMDTIPKPKKAKVDKGPSPIHDVLLHESLDPELWESWVIHKCKMGVPMKHYQAQLEADHLSRLADGKGELEGEVGWVFDIEKLLNELISTGKRSIFIPTHWHFEPKRK